MTNIDRHNKIREMEKAGCELVFGCDTRSRDCTVTVYFRGWQTTVVRMDVFDIDRAHSEWVAYRDSVAYRVMSHQDRAQAPKSAQERRGRTKRVVSRSGVATPQVAATVRQEAKARGAA